MIELAAPAEGAPSLSAPSVRVRFLPVLLLLFVGSGCAALIYEIVWFQMLQFVIGSSAVSLGVLLGTFMGGMCLGSLGLARFVAARRHPLRVYAVLELGIAACGLLVLFGMPLVDRTYAAIVGHGAPAMMLRGFVSAICLLPPTLLMGATLPAIARWVESTPRGVAWLGFFYGGNIVGAVAGCLLAGFYLLRVLDMPRATYVAVAINVGVALIALGLAAMTKRAGNTPRRSAPPLSRGDLKARETIWPVYVAIALSGATALGAEVVWTRLLSLLLGGTVYTFSIILAVFLAGLGIGSSVGAAMARALRHPRLIFGICQLLLTLAIAWSAHTITQSLPHWPVDTSLAARPWDKFQFDLARCAWALLPATMLWGASFPLALAAASAPGEDSGRLVGRVYAANTVGAIVGALGSSLLFIRWLGTQDAQRLAIAFAGLAAVLLFGRTLFAAERHRALAGGLSIAAACAVTLFATRFVPPVPPGLIGYGRQLSTLTYSDPYLFVGEGANASVAVSGSTNGVRYFHVSGKVEASSQPHDMRLQRMLGHLPALLHPAPKSVLIVGCGAGVTAGSFVVHPTIERIVICEIEPLIPQTVARYFAEENHDLLNDPRVEVVYDDARHFILTSQEKFDIITSDPIHPWVKGAAVLYSQEYFALCRRHLNPGGMFSQWLPLYETTADAVQSQLATLAGVFPGATVWGNEVEEGGYDAVVLGQAGPTLIDLDALEARLRQRDHARVRDSLQGVGFSTALDLLATYAGDDRDLAPWLKGAQINRERNLRLQYLAGLGLDIQNAGGIYEAILAHRTFPDDLFAPTRPELRAALHTRIEQRW